jgi:hypothetical protein
MVLGRPGSSFRYALLMIASAFALVGVAEALPTRFRPRAPNECVPTTWHDVLVFFLINYITHAMTVSSLPGETAVASIFYQIIALFLPFSGALRGIQKVRTGAVFGEDKLQQAARAGALCIVVRSGDWLPDRQGIQGCTIPGDTLEVHKPRVMVQECQDSPMVPINPTAFRLHGQCRLPQGYHLVRLPESVTISLEHNDPSEVASSQSTVKALLSMIQLGYACVTLYQARDMELEQYGYASFSLTVLPYTIMSFINLLGHLVAPDYTAFHLVRSEVLKEAKSRGGKFDGTMGVVLSHEIRQTESREKIDSVLCIDQAEDGTLFNCKQVRSSSGEVRTYGPPNIIVPSVGQYVKRTKSLSENRMGHVANILTVFIIFAPYIIIGLVTRFHPGSSTASQRFWTMCWLVVGQIGGLFIGAVMNNVGDSSGRMVLLISSVIFVIPAIGGMVTVATMMTD